MQSIIIKSNLAEKLANTLLSLIEDNSDVNRIKLRVGDLSGTSDDNCKEIEVHALIKPLVVNETENEPVTQADPKKPGAA